MDEETIKREAREALYDLEMDSTVSDVKQNGKNWCIQFSGDYGQFCDSFQNQFERDNSPRVIREKIKKHLLEQITRLRNKGGRRASKKGFDETEERDAGALLQEALTQTTRAVGEAIDRTLRVTGATIQSAVDVGETLSAKTTEMLMQPAAGSAARKSAPRKSTKKAKRSGTTRKAVSKTKPAGRTKKAKVKRQKAKVKRG